MLSSDLLQWFKNYGLTLDQRQAELFIKYYQLLIRENRKYNLTRIILPESVLEEHFFDSLAGLRPPRNAVGERLLDLGSGGGFPGIPIKIFLPDLELTIVDASQKKINFLALLCKELGLEDIFLRHARIEELGRGKERESYCWVAARALAPLNVAGELALPLIKVGGYFWAYKGPNALEEMKKADEIIKRCGGMLEDIICYRLPVSKKERVILIFKKIMPAEKLFPRKAGIPQKRPLAKK